MYTTPSSVRLSGFIDDHHIELQALGIRGPTAAHLTVKHSSPSAGGEDHLAIAMDGALRWEKAKQSPSKKGKTAKQPKPPEVVQKIRRFMALSYLSYY